MRPFPTRKHAHALNNNDKRNTAEGSERARLEHPPERTFPATESGQGTMTAEREGGQDCADHNRVSRP